MLRSLLLALMFCASGVAAQDSMRYAVTVDLDWHGDVPSGHPADKHWSRLIAFAHSGRYALFRDGDTASSGLALVATNGRVSVLEAELAEGRRRGRVGASLVLPGIDDGVGRFSFEIDVTAKHNRISFATMLAPSPDWFSGVSGVALLENDTWVNLSVPLWVWDAGADSGPDFSGPNIDTQPRQSVRLLTHPAFLTDAGLRPIGTVRFTALP